MRWVCVVPVKGSASAKSRLSALPETFPARGELAEAFALDTVAALLAAEMVQEVFVVTADPAAAAPLKALGAQIVPEVPHTSASDAGTGACVATRDPLNAAIAEGIRVAHEQYPLCSVAVLTGDLPALTVADVESTLTAATAHDLAMVADEEGTGTTTLLARAGITLTPRFGPGSRAAHETAGHVPLDLPATASIRRDVDTVDNLAEVLRRGVGAHTSALIARSQQVPGPEGR
ncbi:2-phospho-L-lactate guanylyltransferase [Cryobacterium sp. TMB1-7]|nr:2-phospho-L-lactate guanylyltransferase [Cryobacterium sp. TMB1-7]